MGIILIALGADMNQIMESYLIFAPNAEQI